MAEGFSLTCWSCVNQTDMFETSRQLARIPVVAVLDQGAGEQAFWLKQLLKHPLLRDTVVLTTVADRSIALEHDRIELFDMGSPTGLEGCLCCGMNSGLGDVLRTLFLNLLSKRARPIDRVIIEMPNAAGLERLPFTLKHAPFLGQRYLYQMAITLTGGQAFVQVAGDRAEQQRAVFDENLILRLV